VGENDAMAVPDQADDFHGGAAGVCQLFRDGAFFAAANQ
jgi:hypothetical protein